MPITAAFTSSIRSRSAVNSGSGTSKAADHTGGPAPARRGAAPHRGVDQRAAGWNVISTPREVTVTAAGVTPRSASAAARSGVRR